MPLSASSCFSFTLLHTHPHTHTHFEIIIIYNTSIVLSGRHFKYFLYINSFNPHNLMRLALVFPFLNEQNEGTKRLSQGYTTSKWQSLFYISV